MKGRGFESLRERQIYEVYMTRSDLMEAYTHEYDALYNEFREGIIDENEYQRQKNNLDQSLHDDLVELRIGLEGFQHGFIRH